MDHATLGASYDFIISNNSNFSGTFLNPSLRLAQRLDQDDKFFTIRSRISMQSRYMDAISAVKTDLKPRIEELLLHLNATGQIAATAFFTKIFVDLNAVDGEEQLLELFIELSTTAFLGIPFDEVALELIDDVLMNAEQVAQTFSVDGSTPQ